MEVLALSWNGVGSTKSRQREVDLDTGTAFGAGVLITMNVTLLPNVQRLLPALTMSLALLSLLVLGAFLAALNLLSPQICFLGLALAVAVPAISWLQHSMLFFVWQYF